MTVSAVAENKNIKMEGIDVSVFRSSNSSDEYEESFIVETKLHGNLSKRERILLFNSARKCEVSKLLLGDVKLDYQLVGSD